MANLTILDTGYPSVTQSGTQESATNRANSGNAIELKAVEMVYSRGAGTDSNQAIGRYYPEFTTSISPSVVNFASVEVPKIVITGVLDRKTTADMDLVPELDKLITTKGVKLLYYNNTTDGYRDLTDSLGQTDTQHASAIGASTKHFHVFFTDLNIRHTADGTHLRFTLNCEVTA